jgi:penicillin-binding protein 1C
LPYLAPINTKELLQERRAITFTDRHGLNLGTIVSRDRDRTAVIDIDKVSPEFIQAILAAEDGSFYEHGALDLQAIARSLLQLAQTGKLQSGASTITMQLARMLEPAPRDLPSKIKEIWLSWRIAAGSTKDEILESYINRLPMGGNIYGVEAAARIYFGTAASELNVARASLLAAIPNNPNYLNPYDYWQNLKRRQKYVLNRMVVEGYLTIEQRDRAYAETVTLQNREPGSLIAPHMMFWLASQLPPNHQTEIRTTIDYELQKFTQAQVKQIVKSLANQNVNHAAALVIDNNNGQVLAYVGSPNYFSDTQLGSNDGVQALRQPGSTLKPFLYQLALEQRLVRPNTVLADIPTNYAIPGGKLYSPTDYSETFNGPVRLRVALANSLNVPAVKILEKVGVGNFLERLKNLGFVSLDKSKEFYGLGLTLGSGEVNLWELARAYLTVAREGDSIDLQPILFAEPPLTVRQEVRHRETWQLLTNILSDRYARAKSFGVDSILNLPFPTAVKTGTSSNFKDTWTVGFSRDYTVATWVGNFSGEPMRKVSGVMGAAPLWHNIMTRLHRDREPASFVEPVELVSKPVCALSGLKPTTACPFVVSEYFYSQDLTEYKNNPDTFYQITSEGKYTVNLPKEYRGWLAKQTDSKYLNKNLKILAPLDGDTFLSFDSDNSQKLEFKVARVRDEIVEWILNGKTIAKNQESSLFWELQSGKWTLEVKSGEYRDRVSFRVDKLNNKQLKKGFSLR